MGVTYKALDLDLRCPVALKVINSHYLNNEDVRSRFVGEARSAASLRSPNVAAVLHLGATGKDYFYAIEYVQGETLEQLLKRSGSLNTETALEIVTQTANIRLKFPKPVRLKNNCRVGGFDGINEAFGCSTVKQYGFAKLVSSVRMKLETHY